MASVQFEIPESALAAVRCGPEQFSAEVRLAAAAAWYAQGRISQGVAAEVAGLSRAEFLSALARMKQVSFPVDFDKRDQEIGLGQARLRAGLVEWKQVCQEHPVHSGGRHFTRDELHERG